MGSGRVRDVDISYPTESRSTKTLSGVGRVEQTQVILENNPGSTPEVLPLDVLPPSDPPPSPAPLRTGVVTIHPQTYTLPDLPRSETPPLLSCQEVPTVPRRLTRYGVPCHVPDLPGDQPRLTVDLRRYLLPTRPGRVRDPNTFYPLPTPLEISAHYGDSNFLGFASMPTHPSVPSPQRLSRPSGALPHSVRSHDPGAADVDRLTSRIRPDVPNSPSGPGSPERNGSLLHSSTNSRVTPEGHSRRTPVLRVCPLGTLHARGVDGLRRTGSSTVLPGTIGSRG